MYTLAGGELLMDFCTRKWPVGRSEWMASAMTPHVAGAKWKSVAKKRRGRAGTEERDLQSWEQMFFLHSPRDHMALVSLSPLCPLRQLHHGVSLWRRPNGINFSKKKHTLFALRFCYIARWTFLFSPPFPCLRILLGLYPAQCHSRLLCKLMSTLNNWFTYSYCFNGTEQHWLYGHSWLCLSHVFTALCTKFDPRYSIWTYAMNVYMLTHIHSRSERRKRPQSGQWAHKSVFNHYIQRHLSGIWLQALAPWKSANASSMDILDVWICVCMYECACVCPCTCPLTLSPSPLPSAHLDTRRHTSHPLIHSYTVYSYSHSHTQILCARPRYSQTGKHTLRVLITSPYPRSTKSHTRTGQIGKNLIQFCIMKHPSKLIFISGQIGCSLMSVIENETTL